MKKKDEREELIGSIRCMLFIQIDVTLIFCLLFALICNTKFDIHSVCVGVLFTKDHFEYSHVPLCTLYSSMLMFIWWIHTLKLKVNSILLYTHFVCKQFRRFCLELVHQVRAIDICVNIFGSIEYLWQCTLSH